MDTLSRWSRFWAGKTTPLHRADTVDHYRTYAAELRLLFASNDPQAVLEIGCGNGAISEHLGFPIVPTYRGVDISPSMVAEFRRRFPDADLVVESGHSYRDDRTYDMVFSNGVVQCFDRAMMAEHVANAAQMLGEQGILVCASVPWRPLRWLHACGRLGGMPPLHGPLAPLICLRRLVRSSMGRWYGLSEFEKLGKKHGMSVRFFGSVHYVYRFHAILARKPGG